MAKLQSVEELAHVSNAARNALAAQRGTSTTIYVGMGTCGIAAGARDTLRAITAELARLQIEADVEGVGCIGICVKEPLVDIQQAGQPRISYGNVTLEMATRIIEEHLVKGQPVTKWIVGRVPTHY
ncbi:MAG: (2Fe-2S) ferredoxin domain-containing protein [Chloroflexi bacterium]|nr:(2Fe-2S) ferredoxin domain-containing protein [Chloroflexota bacterium]